jgi:hypothetical protein
MFGTAYACHETEPIESSLNYKDLNPNPHYPDRANRHFVQIWHRILQLDTACDA